MLIYKIIHIESGYKYIGQTIRPFIKRYREHLYALRKGNHSNRYLQAAWNKYGEKAFKFEIIKECNSLEELNNIEINLIKSGTNLYNLGEGGNSHFHSNFTKKIIGDSNKIPIVGMCIKTLQIKEYDSATDAKIDGFNDKCIRKCILKFISKRKDGSTFESISHKGWVWISKEDATYEKLKQKSDIAKRGKIRKERAVIGMNIFTNEIKQFRSASEAGRNGFNGTTVHGACKGRIHVHNGFVWVYYDNDNPQSLLKEKIKLYLSNPNKTGPKSWQFKDL